MAQKIRKKKDYASNPKKVFILLFLFLFGLVFQITIIFVGVSSGDFTFQPPEWWWKITWGILILTAGYGLFLPIFLFIKKYPLKIWIAPTINLMGFLLVALTIAFSSFDYVRNIIPFAGGFSIILWIIFKLTSLVYTAHLLWKIRKNIQFVKIGLSAVLLLIFYVFLANANVNRPYIGNYYYDTKIHENGHIRYWVGKAYNPEIYFYDSTGRHLTFKYQLHLQNKQNKAIKILPGEATVVDNLNNTYQTWIQRDKGSIPCEVYPLKPYETAVVPITSRIYSIKYTKDYFKNIKWIKTTYIPSGDDQFINDFCKSI